MTNSACRGTTPDSHVLDDRRLLCACVPIPFDAEHSRRTKDRYGRQCSPTWLVEHDRPFGASSESDVTQPRWCRSDGFSDGYRLDSLGNGRRHARLPSGDCDLPRIPSIRVHHRTRVKSARVLHPSTQEGAPPCHFGGHLGGHLARLECNSTTMPLTASTQKTPFYRGFFGGDGGI